MPELRIGAGRPARRLDTKCPSLQNYLLWKDTTQCWGGISLCIQEGLASLWVVEVSLVPPEEHSEDSRYNEIGHDRFMHNYSQFIIRNNSAHVTQRPLLDKRRKRENWSLILNNYCMFRNRAMFGAKLIVNTCFKTRSVSLQRVRKRKTVFV
jgi:hypothetical protein